MLLAYPLNTIIYMERRTQWWYIFITKWRTSNINISNMLDCCMATIELCLSKCGEDTRTQHVGEKMQSISLNILSYNMYLISNDNSTTVTWPLCSFFKVQKAQDMEDSVNHSLTKHGEYYCSFLNKIGIGNNWKDLTPLDAFVSLLFRYNRISLLNNRLNYLLGSMCGVFCGVEE